MYDLSIAVVDGWVEAWTEGLDTIIDVGNDDECTTTQVTLTWVEAQQLHRWLGERLGQ